MDAPSQPPANAQRLIAWTISAQATLVLILTAALFFLLGRLSNERQLPAAVPHDDVPAARLDLNRATQAELRLLPGVGPNLAERIVDHRRQHGDFQRFDDLRQISGVGPKTLDRLRPWLFVVASRDEAEVEPAPVMRPAKSAKGGKQAALSSPIDINRAEIAELQKLPGIGPKLSQRIVDERTLRGPFKSVEELRRVSGIGVKTLEKLRPLVRVDAPIATAYNE